VCILSNVRSSILFWKKCDIVVSFNSQNGTKVAKRVRDFDIPRTKLTKCLKNKDKTISHCFLSEHTQKHDTISASPNNHERNFVAKCEGTAWCETKTLRNLKSKM